MKCSYHPAVESQESCSSCSKGLCMECAHKIKGKTFCQDCLVAGTEWAAVARGIGMPTDAPRRAGFCALIPGMGAVYNSEYLKALTFFAVFASLVMLGDKVHGIFGFGASVFLVYTIFDSYRSAELRIRKRLEPGKALQDPQERDVTILGWGIFLVILGILFLLQNIIPYYFLDRLWPLLFILLGVYLVYRALKPGKDPIRDAAAAFIQLPKEDN